MDAVKLLTERQPIWDKRYLILEVMKVPLAFVHHL